MDAKHPSNNSNGNSHETSSSKGKEPSFERAESGSKAGFQSGGMTNLVGSIATSTRNMVSALDPRQTDILRQHNSIGSSNNTSLGSAKASTSSTSTSFQHATNALETLGSSSSSGTDPTVGSTLPTRFRSTPSTSWQTEDIGASTGGEMNWDSFLASSESTVQEDRPYNPPSLSSFGHASIAPPTEIFQTFQQQERQLDSHALEPAFQAHLSQPMNLTPANHEIFLEYLKSTADGTTSPYTPSTHQHTRTQPSQSIPYQQVQYSDWSGFSLSNDIQRQQQMDGSQVLAFLDSTSYSDYVDQLESEGINKHQQVRREFVYSEATLGPQTQSLFSTLQLIQHLPSERQDIVHYLLQQGTYSDDIWGRPFGHDLEREEAASLAATRAEQDQFLQQQQQSSSSIGGNDDATTMEMERVLKQIVEDAKKEVKGGETDGKALNRLMMVRSHITMGTK
ncbi:hypothetical protein BGZ49_010315, partial [Haplosporangium sp. Z 27]